MKVGLLVALLVGFGGIVVAQVPDLKQQWEETERELKAAQQVKLSAPLVSTKVPAPEVSSPEPAAPDYSWPIGAGGVATVTAAVALALAWRRKTTVNKDGSSITEEEVTMQYTRTTTTKYLPAFNNMRVTFQHRDTMRKRAGRPRAHLPNVPATPLPVDGTNNAAVSCPIDGNDNYGDCMYAAACHLDNIWTYAQGKGTESVFNQTTIIKDYEQLSGGDNGLDEPTLLQGWRAGLAGVSAATYVDSLDMDVTNVPLTQYLIDQFYGVLLMWSVPDAFINNFTTGARFDVPARPDPNNGHGTPLADVGGDGWLRLWTWGSWCWVSPAFVAAVEPATFVVFSARQFSLTTGLDSKGRHITTQAAAWQACGGNAIPANVINAFPPVSPTPPTPIPTPTPTPPTPTPTPTNAITLTINATLAPGSYEVFPSGTKEKFQELAALIAALGGSGKRGF